jgi:hypothetical protein
VLIDDISLFDTGVAAGQSVATSGAVLLQTASATPGASFTLSRISVVNTLPWQLSASVSVSLQWLSKVASGCHSAERTL